MTQAIASAPLVRVDHVLRGRTLFSFLRLSRSEAHAVLARDSVAQALELELAIKMKRAVVNRF